MSKFLILEDLESRIGNRELYRIAGDGRHNAPEGPTLDQVKLDRVLAEADSVILGYVIGRHTWLENVAYAAVPDVLKGVASDLTRYRLRNDGGNQSPISDEVKDRHDAAMKILRDIQSGKFDLVPPPGAETDAPAADGGLGPVLAVNPASRSDGILEGY